MIGVQYIFTCDKCGEKVKVYEGDYPSGVMPAPMLPPGWFESGSFLYCAGHTIRITDSPQGLEKKRKERKKVD